MKQKMKIATLRKFCDRSSMVAPMAITVAALLSLSANAATWLTDLPSALSTARAENKLVLLSFTGSDWCGWCIRLRNEVFSQPAFEAYAAEHLVLIEADFPRYKAQDDALKQANAVLARHFHVHGYPTLFVLNAQAQQLGSLGYVPGGPNAFLAELDRVSGQQSSAPPPRPARETKHNGPNDFPPGPPPPPFNGAPTFPPQKFDKLVLKGISGPKDRRLAVINNETLGAGESATLKLGESQVKVKCIEIRDQTALVSIDGHDAQELRMRSGL